MRKLLLSSGLLLVLSGSAQEFHIGGGYNGSNVSKAGEEHWIGRAGYQFGADAFLGKPWFLRIGAHLLVRNLNYTFASSAEVPAQEFQYTSRSLAIPLMLGFHLMDPADREPVNIYLQGGATALMNLSADLDNDALDIETAPAQWYIGFGGGLELGFVFVEGGYDIAMTNVFRGDAFNTNPKVNYVHAIAGIRLRLAE